MDENGDISDPRQLIQLDELPQFIDYQMQQSKAAERTGIPLQRSRSENRKTVSLTTSTSAVSFTVYIPMWHARNLWLAWRTVLRLLMAPCCLMTTSTLWMGRIGSRRLPASRHGASTVEHRGGAACPACRCMRIGARMHKLHTSAIYACHRLARC